MKHAISISLGSPERDKKVTVNFNGKQVLIERIGTGGDVERAKALFRQLDGKVDAFGVGGVDLYLRLGNRQYPLRAALRLVEDVKHTPVVDGRGLKHTLERRVFELAAPMLHQSLTFEHAFIPVAVDRIGLAHGVSEVARQITFGDLMIALGIPLPIRGLKNYYRIARLMLPLVSYFPMSMLFYGSGGDTATPKYHKYWQAADLLAGDFLFMRKYLPQDLSGKTVVTNTTTEKNRTLLQERGVRLLITTTPVFEGRSFGTNMMEAALTAYAGLGRPLNDNELNALIDELNLRPSVYLLDE